MVIELQHDLYFVSIDHLDLYLGVGFIDFLFWLLTYKNACSIKITEDDRTSKRFRC